MITTVIKPFNIWKKRKASFYTPMTKQILINGGHSHSLNKYLNKETLFYILVIHFFKSTYIYPNFLVICFHFLFKILFVYLLSYSQGRESKITFIININKNLFC
jgi:hypothetical protein